MRVKKTFYTCTFTLLIICHLQCIVFFSKIRVKLKRLNSLLQQSKIRKQLNFIALSHTILDQLPTMLFLKNNISTSKMWHSWINILLMKCTFKQFPITSSIKKIYIVLSDPQTLPTLTVKTISNNKFPLKTDNINYRAKSKHNGIIHLLAFFWFGREDLVGDNFISFLLNHMDNRLLPALGHFLILYIIIFNIFCKFFSSQQKTRKSLAQFPIEV